MWQGPARSLCNAPVAIALDSRPNIAPAARRTVALESIWLVHSLIELKRASPPSLPGLTRQSMARCRFVANQHGCAGQRPRMTRKECFNLTGVYSRRLVAPSGTGDRCRRIGVRILRADIVHSHQHVLDRSFRPGP